MNQDLFELEQSILDEANARARGDDEANWSAYQDLVKQYGRLLSQSRRLIRVGHTLERQRLAQLEKKNAELLTLHEAYSRFVPQEILDLLLKQSITEIGLGDHIEFEMAILFADLRGFTTLAESMVPEEVFALLNEYLGVVAPLIQHHGGVIDKILGDGILAFFPDTTGESLTAALAIQTAMDGFNQRVCLPQYGFALEVGIGIHSGPCILGTLGDVRRMNTTVISDAVNVASRIEAMTKQYHCPILISQDVFQQSLFTDDVVFRFVDSVRLKGKSEATVLYEARTRSTLSAEALAFVDGFEQAALAFHEGATAKARELFLGLRDSHPDEPSVELYLRRCAAEREFA